MLRTCALACLAASFAASATQVVQPVKDASGTAFSGSGTAWSGNAAVGSVVTIVGRYTTDTTSQNESGLGLKILYDESKFTGVTVSALSTKCMIAAPQIQLGTGGSKAVLGWLDTAVRSTPGSVGWPYAADPTSSSATSPCLNPNSPANDISPTALGAVNLFQFQGTLANIAVGGTTLVTIVADGNVSYANTSPGMANQAVTITAVGAPVCNLDVDANGSVQPFGDGLLMIRYMLGFSGSALTAGVAGSPDPTAVANRIAAMGLALDVDGDGSLVGFRDGILLIRMMLGFTGDGLILGVATTAPRNTAAAYVAYVNTTCGTSYQP